MKSILALLLSSTMMLAACGSDPRSARADHRCTGEFMDLTQEPDYDVDNLSRWQTNEGCDVRLDVALTREGGCYEGVTHIVMGWPPLSVSTPKNTRIFVRDPNNVAGNEDTAGRYRADIELPDNAEDTRLRQQGKELWLDRDGKAAYIVNDDHTELWPFDPAPPGCM